MALTTTTLAAACGANDTKITVTAATGFAAGQLIRVDNEIMAQSAAASGTVVPVRRGLDGSSQVAHGLLADVATGLTTDFPNPPPGQMVAVAQTPLRISLGADTTLNAADITQNTTYVLTKATAAAITLGAPSKAQDGLQVTFRSSTAAAHTVTYAAGILGDAGSSDIGTFAAKVGAMCTLEANAGTWGAVSLSSVTFA